MQLADLEEILSIEREAASPWSEDSLEREVHLPNGVQLVVEDEDNGLILGWCCGRQIGPEAELLKISVLRNRRESGIASTLIACLVQEFSTRGVDTLFLEVRAGNIPALQLYRKHGFSEIGLRRKYYADPEEDALLLRKILLKRDQLIISKKGNP